MIRVLFILLTILTLGTAGIAGGPEMLLPMMQSATGYSDASFSSVSLLLHANGPDGGTTIIDSAYKCTATPTNATISTTKAKFGLSSLRIVSSTSGLTLSNTSDLQLGSGNFTLETWYYADSYPANQILINLGSKGAANYGGILLQVTSAGKTGFTMSVSGTSWQINNNLGSATVTTGVWHHIALVRSGNVYTCYLDGVQDSTVTYGSGSEALYGGTLHYIGNMINFSTGTYYMDDVRITKGVARYTTTFTPPNAAFPNN